MRTRPGHFTGPGKQIGKAKKKRDGSKPSLLKKVCGGDY
jgi:hypothetical protein